MFAVWQYGVENIFVFLVTDIVFETYRAIANIDAITIRSCNKVTHDRLTLNLINPSPSNCISSIVPTVLTVKF